MMDFMKVLSHFGKNVTLTAWEVEGGYIGQKWVDVEVPGSRRTIEAVVLQRADKAYQLDPQGGSVDADLAFHTYETLYFNDITEVGIQGLQTYIMLESLVYRVTSSGQFTGNVVSNLYSAQRRFSAND